ncbi:phage repressor protein/antirepressor Ant [Lactobacillus mulieris]|uniref:BRO family protein n=1 Tax=Lactobacillus mulieris TaxID=2508708 RepID=UPI00143304F7|nr:BRO family protein [Lactobacillus mulieris]MDK6563797.1 BRO family protein [Lactobacillus mulieris]MDK8082863.1 BRO family protein [Lactobacillus mulieris]NKC42918.1 phage repressor protein/antirepressor Ant [Lactobacillus mulieris]
MKNLRLFQFEEQNVRTLVIDDEPYFVGKDVAEILGYSDLNRAINQHVDREDRKALSRRDKGDSVPSLWMNKNDFKDKILINESGLYSLIMASQLPTAKKFKRWVTHEVLPTIRKHGAYMTEQKIEEALLNPDTLITLAKQLKAEKEQRLLAQKQVEEMTPKAVFHDAVANAENTMLVRDVAHFLRQNGVDIGGTRFFVWLRLNGFLTKNNQPTQLSLERGYFRVKETVVHTNHGFQTKTTPKITGRGQTFFLKKMLKEQEEMKEMGL